MRQSGRSCRNEAEQLRRQANPAYRDAIAEASTFRRRTADISLFRAYIDWSVSHLRVRVDELCDIRRCLRRFKGRRQLQSFLSSTADRIAQRESRRRLRGSVRWDLLTAEERVELHHRFLERARQRGEPGRRTVVFFGDGQFGHMRGCAAVPKKSLLHELGIHVDDHTFEPLHGHRVCVCMVLVYFFVTVVRRYTHTTLPTAPARMRSTNNARFRPRTNFARAARRFECTRPFSNTRLHPRCGRLDCLRPRR